ncbi:hypothetical protein lerEdw1_017446 [Lerista edwardsae]|nr:hypothetical protein lerEdw1_017446 [Lerista edwardsae]
MQNQFGQTRQKSELEIQAFFDEGSECSLDLWDQQYKLSKELDAFQENTVQPIWQLREDLKYRLSEMQTNCEQPGPEYQCNLDEVIEEVEFVKKQQKIILEKLQRERVALERELEDCTSNALVCSLEERSALFHGIPPQLLTLECPYPDLKESVFVEFHKLANEYWLKFQEVDKDLKAISR